MIVDLPGKRLAKLSADILTRVPLKMVAEELVGKLSDSFVEELADEPMDGLVHVLAQRLNDELLDSIADAMTDWLEEQLVKAAQKGTVSLHPTRSPTEMAQWLTRQMADESGVDIFSNPAEVPTIRQDEVDHTIFRIAGLAATMIFTRAYKRKSAN